VAAGDYTDAQTMYSDLPLRTTDDRLYAWEAGLMINLYSSGLTGSTRHRQRRLHDARSAVQ